MCRRATGGLSAGADRRRWHLPHARGRRPTRPRGGARSRADATARLATVLGRRRGPSSAPAGAPDGERRPPEPDGADGAPDRALSQARPLRGDRSLPAQTPTLTSPPPPTVTWPPTAVRIASSVATLGRARLGSRSRIRPAPERVDLTAVPVWAAGREWLPEQGGQRQRSPIPCEAHGARCGSGPGPGGPGWDRYEVALCPAMTSASRIWSGHAVGLKPPDSSARAGRATSEDGNARGPAGRSPEPLCLSRCQGSRPRSRSS